MSTSGIRKTLEKLGVSGVDREFITIAADNLLFSDPIGTTKTKSFLLCYEEKKCVYVCDGHIPKRIMKMYQKYDRYYVTIVGVKHPHDVGSQQTLLITYLYFPEGEYYEL